MKKVINLKNGEKEYTLEFTRRTVQKMEKQGFKISEISDMPATYIPMLFQGAFMANHPFVKEDEVEELYALIPDKATFVGKLSEMYIEPIEALMAETEPVEGKNVTWGADW